MRLNTRWKSLDRDSAPKISPIHTFVNIPVLLLKNTLRFLIRAGILTKVWIGDMFSYLQKNMKINSCKNTIISRVGWSKNVKKPKNYPWLCQFKHHDHNFRYFWYWHRLRDILHRRLKKGFRIHNQLMGSRQHCLESYALSLLGENWKDTHPI